MLNLTELIGFGAGGEGGITALTYVGKTENTANQSSYTFSSVSIGSGDYLIAVVKVGGASGSVTDVTVNGGGFTNDTITGAGNDLFFGIIAHPGGSTADFVATTPNGGRCVLYIYTATGTLLSLTPDSVTLTGSDANSSINVPAGGIVIGNTSRSSTTTTQYTAGLTHDDGNSYEGSVYYSVGSRQPSGSAVTGLTVSVTAGAVQHAEVVWR